MGDPFAYPRDVVEGLHRELEWRARKGPKLHIPTKENLAALLDTVLAISLVAEEGQPTHFTIGVVPPSALEGAYKFNAPLDLTPGKVRKLAPGLNYENTVMLVHESPEAPAGWLVWGALHKGSTLVPIGRELVFAGFSLQSMRPGYLEGRFAGARVFRYNPAQGARVLKFDEFSDHALAKLVMAFFPRPGEPNAEPELCKRANDFELERWNKARVLLEIAQEMRSGLHGGLLLVIPPAVDPVALSFHDHFTPMSPCEVLARRFRAAIERSKGGDDGVRQSDTGTAYDESVLFARGALRDGMLFAIELSKVDGAVLLDSDLRILGFGSTVQAAQGDVQAQKVNLRPPLFEPYKGLAVKGTRHRAAVSFCAAQPGEALALCVSQDGNLMLVARAKLGSDWMTIVLDPLEVER